jgi:glutathione S-transferase-like protein
MSQNSSVTVPKGSADGEDTAASIAARRWPRQQIAIDPAHQTTRLWPGGLTNVAPPRTLQRNHPCSVNRESVRIRGVPKVKLLALPASHACAVATAMLDAKRLPYQRVDLFPGLSRAWLRLTGFDGVTVPALRIDGARIQGSRAAGVLPTS